MERKDFETKGYDTTITYEYKEMPDVRAGRCDYIYQIHDKAITI
ncbi:hypothetical protein [Bacillus inaquosorum]